MIIVAYAAETALSIEFLLRNLSDFYFYIVAFHLVKRMATCCIASQTSTVKAAPLVTKEAH
jgi:hypothetical protein